MPHTFAAAMDQYSNKAPLDLSALPQTKPSTHKRIAVFGLGYVGTVSSACLAQLGHEVVGVDVNENKVGCINQGKSPIVEKDLDGLLQTAVEEGRLAATTDFSQAMAWADVSLVCVGTPSRPNGSLDTSYVERVVQAIGVTLRDREDRHTVVIRSTLLPGTTETVLKPILEKASGKTCGSEVGLAYNPEFLRESTAVKDFADPPYTVIGGADQESIATASEVYQGVNAAIHTVSIPEAEMIKYTANAFHALKITFANEIGMFSKSVGVDSHKVMNLIAADTKLNISKAYLRPGFAYGGSCLPKDLRALLYGARRNDLTLPLLQSLPQSNLLQIDRAINQILSLKKRRIGVLGFSFKAGTDDLRESPIVQVIEALIGKGYDLKLYDRNVNIMKLTGTNKDYIDSVIPHISDLMVDTWQEAVRETDVLIVGNNSPEFGEALANPVDQTVIDFVRLPALTPEWVAAMGERYHGISW